MKLFEYVTLAEKKVSGLRINFLWVFNITVTYSTNKGNHVNIGFLHTALQQMQSFLL